jgi:hypothetical protein
VLIGQTDTSHVEAPQGQRSLSAPGSAPVIVDDGEIDNLAIARELRTVVAALAHVRAVEETTSYLLTDITIARVAL